MMKGLEIIHLCRKISAIPLSRGIRTDAVLQAKVRRGIPRTNPDEPGIRRRRALFQNEEEDAREEMENEGDLEDEVDLMNIDKAYNLNERERYRNKRKLEYMITAKKFFTPRPQPPMLTCNERQCIKHLHMEDPVQWNIKTLSESFPATPDTIKKIIKGKWKITPERAKVIDERVQKNWELLAEGKLDADPQILEHFKRFINRREVLLEQLKNENFYLPEVKPERVWNQGEFSGLLQKYERDVEQLIKNTQPKMLKDGMEKNNTEEDKSSLDLIHEKIKSEVARRPVEKKDSFLFREMTKFYSRHTTLEDLEERILKQVDSKKNLDVVDKAILEAKFGVKVEKNSSETLAPSESIRKNMEERWEMEEKHFMSSDKNDESVMAGNGRFNRMRPQEEEMEFEKMGRSRRFNRIRPEEMEFKNRNSRIDGSVQKNIEERWEMEDKHFMSSDKNDESVMAGNGRFNRMRPQEEEMEFEKMGRGRRFNRIRPEEAEEMEFKNRNSRIDGSIQKNMEERWEMEEKHFMSSDKNDESVMAGNVRFNRMRPQEEEIGFEKIGRSRRFNRIRPEEAEEMDSNGFYDDRTQSASETDIGRLLEKVRNQPQQKEEKAVKRKEIVEEKPKIDFSDPERLKRENIYYDNEVKDIENTAFWNSGRSSKEKALAERQKRPHDGPEWALPDVNRASTAVLSKDKYPERIKIPRDKQRSGLIFKVKDCYYDDDGEFLYRVPGMSK